MAAFDVYCAGLSDTGNFRQNNEDYVFAADLDAEETLRQDFSVRFHTSRHGAVIGVCDGLGGGASGEVASAQTAEVLVQHLRHLVRVREDPRQLSAQEREAMLKEAATLAHESVLEMSRREPRHDGMASTLVTLWILGDKAVWLNIGDSRLYRSAKRRLVQLSVDQSPVGKLVHSGRLTEEEARQHPLKNLVDQVVGGQQQDLQPEIRIEALQRGDLFLLCSDGLSDSLEDAQIQMKLSEALRDRPAGMANALMHQALKLGGRDNVTLALVRIGEERASRLALLRRKLGL